MRYGDLIRRRRTRRLGSTLRFVVLGGLLALVVAGAAMAALRGDSTSKASDTLVIANAVKIDTLDPANNSVNESIWLTQNIYNRLVQPNRSGTALQPDLATSWDISKNGLVYTFHLRKASFSDGSPITAEDARYSIVSSFFSEVFGYVLRLFGDPAGHDALDVEGDFGEGEAIGRFRKDGETIAAVTTGQDDEAHAALEQEIRAGASAVG